MTRLPRPRALSLPLLLLFAACGVAGGRPARPDHPERLDRRWALDLRLEEPLALRGDTLTAGTVRGEIALIDNPAVRGALVAGRPTHFGVYTADFAPFGFTVATGGIPTAAARLLGADSVEISLDPADGRAVVLRGRLAGDSIVGHWRYEAGRSAAAAGRFVMRGR